MTGSYPFTLYVDSSYFTNGVAHVVCFKLTGQTVSSDNIVFSIAGKNNESPNELGIKRSQLDRFGNMLFYESARKRLAFVALAIACDTVLNPVEMQHKFERYYIDQYCNLFPNLDLIRAKNHVLLLSELYDKADYAEISHVMQDLFDR